MLVADSLKLVLDSAKSVSDFFKKDKSGLSKSDKLKRDVILGIGSAAGRIGSAFQSYEALPKLESGQANKIVNIRIDGVDINVPEGANPIEVVARQLMSNLEQASEELNTGVDQ
jgi:hypothetical protein